MSVEVRPVPTTPVAPSLFAVARRCHKVARALGLKGGGFRHGRRWKLWAQWGDCVVDVGLGRFWITLWRFTFTADRTPYRATDGPKHYTRLRLEWMWRR